MLLGLLSSLALSTSILATTGSNVASKSTISKLEFEKGKTVVVDQKTLETKVQEISKSLKNNILDVTYDIGMEYVAADGSEFTFIPGTVSTPISFVTALALASTWESVAANLGALDWQVNAAGSLLAYQGIITAPGGSGTLQGYASGLNSVMEDYFESLDDYSHSKGSTGIFYFGVGAQFPLLNHSLNYLTPKGETELIGESNYSLIPPGALATVALSMTINVQYII